MQKLIIHKADRGDINRLDQFVMEMGLDKEVGYFARQFDYQESGSRAVFIAVLEGQDVGFCILNWTPKYGLFKKLDVPEVQDLNVLYSQRRQGFATQMIYYCEGLARERGKEYMGIGVSVSSGFGPAQRLYTKLGYVPDGNGVSYDRKLTTPGEFRPLDDQLCLMMLKEL